MQVKAVALVPAWGGPFCGRTLVDVTSVVYQGARTEAVSLGIPFLGGRTLGTYVRDPEHQRLVWRPR